MMIPTAMRFACAATAAIFFLMAPNIALAAQYRCGDGTITSVRSVCDNRGGLAMDNIICGNGYIEAGEQCDNGSNNTDNQPNGCRNDCRNYYCGDGVADSNEQCDSSDLKGAICSDFDKSGHMIYNNPDPYYWGGTLRCKIDQNYNCKYDFSQCQYCGDGIVQPQKEQCDDGNNVDDDGCNRDCTSCIALTTNPEITSDTQICTAEYAADDYGDLGAIIIKAPNLTLDCDGARLTGTGDGIGIYIKRSDNVTVKNCNIDNYEFGIYAEDSDNIKVLGMGNRMTNTTEQLVLDNSTAQPAPPPEMQQFGGVNPNVQALMGQQIQPRTVTPQMGDALKAQALPKAAATLKPSVSGEQTTPATESREERRARLKVEREARTAERKAEREERQSFIASKDVRAVSKEPVRSFSPPVAQQQESTPVILSPEANQQFAASEAVNASARFDSNRRVIYLLKQLPDKRTLKRSRDGRFGTLAAGRYCVAALYIGKGEMESPCIEFSVNPVQREIAPLKTPLRLQRQ